MCISHNPSFQGCCDLDPCSRDTGDCPQSLLHPAAFKSVLGDTSSTSPYNTASKMTTPTADFSFSTRPMIDINPSTTTGTQLSNTLTTHVSEITSYNTMPTGPSEVIATSISTFTAMQISVYTVPYSSSDSNYPPDSSLLSTGTSTLAPSSLDSTSTTFLPQAASSTSLSPTNSNPLPPSKTTNMKLIACGTTGGIAFILIFAILFWFLRRRQKRNNNSRDEPTDTWLPWTRRVKEIPRTTLSSYPFKEMASPTSTSSGEVANETWNASLRDYRNIRMMDIMRHGMNSTYFLLLLLARTNDL